MPSTRAARAAARRLAAAAAGALALSALAALSAPPAAAEDRGVAGDGWRVASSAHGVVIRTREAAGGGVREIEARARLEAPLPACRDVLRAPERFPELMPHVEAVEILRREPELLVYQRVTAPFVAPRDYVVRLDESDGPDGAWRQCWRGVTGEGPPPTDGVVRVDRNEGCWLLEEDGQPGRTLATYRLLTDPGGRIPAPIVNRANRRMVRSLLRAVERRAAEAAAAHDGASRE